MPRDPQAVDHPDRRTLLRATLFAVGAGAGGLITLPGCCGLLDDEEPEPVDGAGGEAAPDPTSAETTGPTVDRGWRQPPDREPLVRIRLTTHEGPGAITVGAAGTMLVLHAGGTGVRVPAPIAVRRDGDAWTWTDAEERTGRLDGPLAEIGTPTPDLGDRPVGAAPAPDPTGRLRWADADWPGLMRLVPAGGDDAEPHAVHVVLVTGMERYLPGVLARELFPSWHPATFAALAVAARSFATFATLERAARAWDLESDQRSQVFAGATDVDRSHAAVAATAGTVLTYGGNVVPAFYSSTCGGIGMPATAGIGPDPANDVPPLTGHALGDCCRDAPRHTWTAVRTPRRLTAQLLAWARANPRRAGADWRGVAAVRSIAVRTRTPGGRPLDFDIVAMDEADRGRRLVVTAPQLRRALHADRTRREAPVWSGFVEPVVLEDGSIRFDGRGWGHGVGLCQYGAQRGAREGWSHERILDAYYPGARRTRAWPSPATLG